MSGGRRQGKSMAARVLIAEALRRGQKVAMAYTDPDTGEHRVDPVVTVPGLPDGTQLEHKETASMTAKLFDQAMDARTAARLEKRRIARWRINPAGWDALVNDDRFIRTVNPTRLLATGTHPLLGTLLEIDHEDTSTTPKITPIYADEVERQKEPEG